MRLAWFSPFPPVKTGISAVSAELVALLRGRGHAIDIYPSDRAHDFPWTHRQRPYELIVYQFGNSSHHDYEWAYALRYPGLVVLHDTRLHHARAAFLLREKRAADYRAEFRWNHPDVVPDAAELGVAGFDSQLYYEWPMTRALVESARLAAVHSYQPPTSTLQSQVICIRLGHGELVTPDRREKARRVVRAQYGIANDAVLFVCAGGITPEKRIPQVLSAFADTLRHAPDARLLLVGGTAAHYDAHADIAARVLTDRVTITGYVESDAELTDHFAAADVSVNLRWPTAGEISGPWLRALGAGVATVITDLAHLGDVPSIDPRTWKARGISQPPTSNLHPPVCVAIDILDENHSLRLAMRRLATDADLREKLARAGQAYWLANHTPEAMADDYERAITAAAERADPTVDLPQHMRSTADGTLERLLAPFGVSRPL
jgi:glycosyltransferase involved in cell wall biosynthesis